MNQYTALSVVFVFSISLCGCLPTQKQFHPQWGFAEDNPVAYKNDSNDCFLQSMVMYPQQNMPQLLPSPPPYKGEGVGLMVASARRTAEVNEYNRSVLELYKAYNESRKLYFNQCVDQKRWYYVNVE